MFDVMLSSNGKQVAGSFGTGFRVVKPGMTRMTKKEVVNNYCHWLDENGGGNRAAHLRSCYASHGFIDILVH